MRRALYLFRQWFRFVFLPERCSRCGHRDWRWRELFWRMRRGLRTYPCVQCGRRVFECLDVGNETWLERGADNRLRMRAAHEKCAQKAWDRDPNFTRAT
jgi:hypothetical protein